MYAEANAPLIRAGSSAIENSSAAPNHNAITSLRSVTARIAAFFDGRAQAEHAIADKYVCHSWCDSTEWQINDELMGIRNKFVR